MLQFKNRNKILAYSRASLGCLLVTTNLLLSLPVTQEIFDHRQNLANQLYVFGLGGFMYFFALQMPYYDPRYTFKAEPDFISNNEKAQHQHSRFLTDLYPAFYYMAEKPQPWQRLFFPTFCRRLLRLWDAPPGASLTVTRETVQLEWKDQRILQTPSSVKDLVQCQRE